MKIPAVWSDTRWLLAAWCSFLCSLAGREAATISEGATLNVIGASFNKFPDATWRSGQGIDIINPCAWRYVTCNAENRVTELDLRNLDLRGPLISLIGEITYLEKLYLQGNNLTGTLPASLGLLQSLSVLNASRNAFSGQIPETFGQTPSLTSLNLANNALQAPIPQSVQARFCYPNFEGNPAVVGLNASDFPPCPTGGYTAPPPPDNGGSSVAPSLAGALGGTGVVLLLLIGSFIFLVKYGQDVTILRPSDREVEEVEATMAARMSQLSRFTIQELFVATQGFSSGNRLGEGGHAEVFRGILPNGKAVAVKRLKSWRISRSDLVTFLNEMDTMSRAVHRNVLKLEGYCIEKAERVMVLPYMPLGSVRDHLQGQRKPGMRPLSLDVRKQIALDVARGLDYLHEHCTSKIIHRDIKAANVLLTAQMEAVVADFGLAKLLQSERSSATTVVRGTHGHIAPEYIVTGQVNEKTDVYGFGVFLVELITGRDATWLAEQPQEGCLLHDWVCEAFQQDRGTEIVDFELLMMDVDVVQGEYRVEILKDLVQVAILCLSPDPKQRPSMADVIQLLRGEGLDAAWEMMQKDDDKEIVEQHDLLYAADGAYQSKLSMSSIMGSGSLLSFIGRNNLGRFSRTSDLSSG